MEEDREGQGIVGVCLGILQSAWGISHHYPTKSQVKYKSINSRWEKRFDPRGPDFKLSNMLEIEQTVVEHRRKHETGFSISCYKPCIISTEGVNCTIGLAYCYKPCTQAYPTTDYYAKNTQNVHRQYNKSLQTCHRFPHTVLRSPIN